MTDIATPPDAERPRTATRLRYVAPPGMELGDQKNIKTIGRYEILETLGKGAMGVVYKARDPLLDRTVAVKTIMSPKVKEARNRRAYLERFEREAKAAAKMQHQSIVTIFDVGSDNGQPFMVLEYLPGDSLADRLDKVRMPLGKAVETAIDLASALGFAHDARIVHRDVKPANVLNAGENRWKLADFGIARMPDSDLTQVGIFMGTPGYAPPEAISHGTYTAQADVFAWGAVFYELLCGRIPYEGPDTRTTNGYVLKNLAKSPIVHDPSIPPIIAEVCMTALHPSVERRYKDGTEAMQALSEAWERCINEELVSPKAFSKKEIPHAQAPKMMHGTGAAERAGDTEEVGGLVIESSLQIGDDDPTRIMTREPAMQGGSAGRPSPLTEELDPDEALMRKAKAVANQDDSDEIMEAARKAAAGDSKSGDRPTGMQSKMGLWIAASVAVLFAGGFAAYYLLNS